MRRLTPGRLFFVAAFLAITPPARAQDAVRLSERFDGEAAYRVELRVEVSGRLALPAGKDAPSKVVPLSGKSLLVYDERGLPADESGAGRAARIYRDVEFRRTVGDEEQRAEVRQAVRRMVVMRSERGKKAPFSPDGPLTWGEIDAVRTDLFCPALVPGLLPAREVRPGDTWPASPAAVAELTDLDPVDEGTLTVGFERVVELDGRRLARLSLSGTVKGQGEDGPTRHRLDGTGYFALDTAQLSYLNLKGTRELLGPDGKVGGRIDGTFKLTRSPAGRVPELLPAALGAADLRPTADNTLLLYDNPDLGVRFLYPRRWRVGGVRGRQVTLDEPRGGGVLITVEPADAVPLPRQYLAETRDYLAKQKGTVFAEDGPRRWLAGPPRVDRFTLDAEVGDGKARLEYAVVSADGGGATVAARLPWADRDELAGDLDRVLKSLATTKRIGK